MSLNNEKICREISEDKIAVCEKTAGLRRGNFSYIFELSVLESVSSRKNISVPRQLNENERYRDAANGLFVTVIIPYFYFVSVHILFRL